MAIDFVPAEDVKSSRGGKGGNGVKYGKYAEAIAPHVQSLKDKIAEHTIIRIKTKELAKEIGGEFEKKNATSIYWGLKYSLFGEGIVVNTGTHKDGDKLLIMRARTADDVLPDSLAKNKSDKESDKGAGVKKKDNDTDPTDLSIEEMIGVDEPETDEV